MMQRRRHTNRMVDRGAFAFFALFGGVCIIAIKLFAPTGTAPGSVVFWLPVATSVGLMFVYAMLVSVRRSRFRLRFDQAGDNAYYLGFAYTLISLGYALYGFGRDPGGGSIDSVTEIVSNFGVALATTLVGIVLRVLLHQMREDPHDVEEAARLELGRAAVKVIGQLGSMTRDVTDFRLRTQQDLKHFAYETRQVVEEQQTAAKDLAARSAEIAGEAARIAGQFRTVNIPVDMMEQSLARTAETLGEIVQLSRDAAAADARTKAETGALVGMIAQSAERIADFVAQFERVEEIPQRIVQTLEGAEKATASLAELEQAASAVAVRLETGARDLAAGSAEISGEAARIAGQFRTVNIPVDMMEQSLARTAETLGEIVQLSRDVAAADARTKAEAGALVGTIALSAERIAGIVAQFERAEEIPQRIVQTLEGVERATEGLAGLEKAASAFAARLETGLAHLARVERAEAVFSRIAEIDREMLARRKADAETQAEAAVLLGRIADAADKAADAADRFERAGNVPQEIARSLEGVQRAIDGLAKLEESAADFATRLESGLRRLKKFEKADDIIVRTIREASPARGSWFERVFAGPADRRDG